MEICHDVCIEPGLQPSNGESMSYHSANRAPLDIAACGIWGLLHQ